MKRISLIFMSFAILISLVGCSSTLTAPDELIEKARAEIPVSDAESIDIQIVSSIEKEDGNSLIWFMSGNESQAHYYLPMECVLKDSDEYEFVRVGKPFERGTDIVVYEWQNGYAFLVNNKNCKSVQITDGTGTHTVEITEENTYPFTFYQEVIPSEYSFLDASGNELN